MRHLDSGQQEACSLVYASGQTLQALRACEPRILDLQSRQVSREQRTCRNALLQTEVAAALQTAQACAAEGGLRAALPADLAGLTNSFSKMHRPPVTGAIDAILELLKEELILRNTEGSLSQWTPLHLALVINGLSKGNGPWVEAALTQLALAFHTASQHESAYAWTPRILAMVANGLAKGKGDAVLAALNQLAHRLLEGRHQPWGSAWNTQSLTMMANGLSKGEGDTVLKALNLLARTLRRGPPLTVASGWTAQSLAIMANGLSRGQGPDIEAAFLCLAQAIIQQETPLCTDWSPRSLAVTALALSRVTGATINMALTCLARAVPDCAAREGQWTAQNLAMLASGLVRGEGEPIIEALTQLAQLAVPCQLRAPQDWTAQDLAMLTQGLGRVCAEPGVQQALAGCARLISARLLDDDPDWTPWRLALSARGLARADRQQVQEALTRLADRLEGQSLTAATGWSGQPLAMMLGALEQTLYQHPSFARISTALAQQADSEPEVLVSCLTELSRCALGRAHLDTALELLDALKAVHFVPAQPQTGYEMLWYTTLFHFASQKKTPVDPQLAEAFAAAYQHCLSVLSVLSVTASAYEAADNRDDRPDDRPWHSRWAQAYWQPATADRRETPVPARDPEATASRWQRDIFDCLSRQLPDRDVRIEQEINGFPVDIMIDRHVCIEVDGPSHFVQVPVAFGSQGSCVFVRTRRTRDLFVDHMLQHHYGYPVLRVSCTDSPASLHSLPGRIRSVLAATAEPPATGTPTAVTGTPTTRTGPPA